jgi:hypothetical protein
MFGNGIILIEMTKLECNLEVDIRKHKEKLMEEYDALDIMSSLMLITSLES